MGPMDKHLGTFDGGALTFVRELLHGEQIAHREEPCGHGGELRSEIWIAATEHDRALALLAEAQAEAEAAARRETALLEAEESRAATEAARVAAVEAHRAARRAAKEARRRERRRPWLALRRPSAPASPPDEPPIHALRIVAGAIVGFILAIVLITWIGERWGTRRPTPGTDGHPIVCNGKYQALCVPR